MSTQDIIALGNDQISSQYDLTIDSIPTGGSGENVMLRCDLTFTNPAETVGTYMIHKKGVSIEKTNMVTGTDKKFTIEWRVDQDWDTFNNMKKWYDAVYDPITGTGMPDAAGIRATISMQAVDTQNVVKQIIRYTGCKPFHWELTNFDNAGADPIRCSMQFIYVDRKIEAA